jgi:tRNA-intron endonuclease
LPGKPEAELLPGGHLVVWSVEEGRTLFNSDFFGKPLGNPKPKENFVEPLVLDLIEATYLLEKKKLRVKSEGKTLSLTKLRAKARSYFAGFDERYAVYRDLRERGLVVTPGMKYGCDFAVYEHGPGIDHAPYVVQVASESDNMGAIEIVKAGRLASTVRKAFILAIPEDSGVRYMEFRWWKA